MKNYLTLYRRHSSDCNKGHDRDLRILRPRNQAEKARDCTWVIHAAGVKEGREEADAKVTKSLFKRATGYTDKDGREVPPDPRAIEFWLRNRQRHTKRWTDKQEIEITTDDATLEARLLAARKRVNDEKK